MTAVKMSRRDIITLLLLVSMSVFLFADQRIMSAIIDNLQIEYDVDEFIIGAIGSAFTLIGAFISIFFGYFTDKVSRKKLLIATVLIGEIPCLLTGIEFFTQNLASFITLRMLTGIGIGGIYPISFSLISDYFKEEHRATASAWLGVSWAVGMTLGPILAGYLTQSYGWRIAFILAAVPNFPIAIFFALYAREPERGRTEDALEDLIQKGMAYKQRITLRDFTVIFSNKTNLLTFLQGIPGTIPWGILSFWMIYFLQKVRFFSKADATTAFLVLAVGATAGGIIFAIIGDRLYRKNPKLMPLMCGIGVLVGIVPALFFTNIDFRFASGTDMAMFYILAFVAGFLVAVPSNNVKAILMNVNRPEHRGSVFAVFNITDNLGQGFGPFIGGILVGMFFPSFIGYLFMMNFSIFWWILCGVIFLFVALTIVADRNRLQSLLSERAREMEREES